MTLAVYTGKIQYQPCAICGKTVQHRELRTNTPPIYDWHAVPHVAPCGMTCFGGGVITEDIEAGNIHAYPKYPCPACGFVASIVVKTIEKPDGMEKVEIQQYFDLKSYTIHHYRRKDETWQPADAYPGFGCQSEAEMLTLAARYIPWLNDVLQNE